jgi:hypothetical protein
LSAIIAAFAISPYWFIAIDDATLSPLRHWLFSL